MLSNFKNNICLNIIWFQLHLALKCTKRVGLYLFGRFESELESGWHSGWCFPACLTASWSKDDPQLRLLFVQSYICFFPHLHASFFIFIFAVLHTSQKHAGRWIGGCKLPLGVHVCMISCDVHLWQDELLLIILTRLPVAITGNPSDSSTWDSKTQGSSSVIPVAWHKKWCKSRPSYRRQCN